MIQIYIQSNVLKMLAPSFSEIDGLFYDKLSSIGVVKDRLDKLLEKAACIGTMSQEEYTIIKSSYLKFYFQWLACICYYGGGSKNSIEFLKVARYN